MNSLRGKIFVAIANVINKIRENGFERLGPLNIDDINDLLEVLMLNSFLQFEGTIFKQIQGLPMGCSLSGIMAILFMDTIEKRVLRSFGNIGIFRHYIDDCFALVRNEGEAKQLLDLLNAQHPNIRFEIEYPESNKTLNLLDFKTTFYNDDVTIEFYRKKARKRIFINHNSHMPGTQKEAIILNEISRIEERCSSEPTTEKCKRTFYNTLCLNDHPPSKMNELYQKHKRRNKNKTTSKNKEILN